MNRIEIFVRHDAELDAFGYFQRILEHNPAAATRFLEAIDLTIKGLALQPLRPAAKISRPGFEKHPLVARG